MDSDIRFALERGGARRRLSLLQSTAAASTDATPARSRLAEVLLRMFAWGLLTATVVQWIARAAVDDGLRHPDLERLANIGTNCEFAGNSRRDLLRYFSHRCGWPNCRPCGCP